MTVGTLDIKILGYKNDAVGAEVHYSAEVVGTLTEVEYRNIEHRNIIKILKHME